MNLTGHKGAWNLVECGPGTGQLSADLLRVFDKFGVSHLVFVLLPKITYENLRYGLPAP